MTPDAVAAALAAGSRAEVRDALGTPRAELGPAAAARLIRHLRAVDPAAPPLRVAVLRGYATEMLAPWLELELRLGGFGAQIEQLPYGLLRLGPGEATQLAEPDLVLVFAAPEDLAPALAGPRSLLGAADAEQRVAEAVAGLGGIVAGIRAVAAAPIAVSILPRTTAPELGAHEAMSVRPAAAFEHALAAGLAAHLRDAESGATLVDMGGWLAEVGRRHAFDARLWHSSRIPFSAAGSQHLARHAIAAATPLLRPPAKCLVLDADNTLWGGIVGEDGIDGIALGPDHPGSCFVAFQRRVQDFRRRGILLALASKNEPADVLAVLRDHPHQVLREDAFAAIEIGWGPKSESLERIAQTLSIGVDSLVFVDDSPHEVGALRALLPAVEVIHAPAEPTLLETCLDEVPRLEVARLTDEDRRRPELYAQEARRRTAQAAAATPDDYLRSLEIVMTVAEDDESQLPRLAQLCGRTNQFNATTRRHTEAGLRGFMDAPDAMVLSFALADVLGDSGIVGLAVLTNMTDEEAEIDTYLMSCRVIGRRAETAFLAELLDRAHARGVRRVRAIYEPTPRNRLVADLWPQHGFAEAGAGAFVRDLDAAPDLPEAPITIVRVESAGAGSVGGSLRERPAAKGAGP